MSVIKIEKREMVDNVIISFQCKVENRSKRSTIPEKCESLNGGVTSLSYGLQWREIID